MTKQERQYQDSIVNKLASLAGRGHLRMIGQGPTGCGKSVIFAKLIKRYLDKQQRRVLVACHREKLVRQCRKTLFEWFGITATAVFAETKQLAPAMVYAGMAETLYNRFKANQNYITNIGLLVVDECHLGIFTKLFDHFPDTLIIGFTATPIAAKKTHPLNKIYSEIVCGPQIGELISEGSLCKNLTYHIPNINRKELKVTNGEFDETFMGKVLSGGKHVQNTIAEYRKHLEGKKTIIFNASIEHSKIVNDAFVKFSYNARHLDGYMSKEVSASILNWFETTPGAILNNVAVATTGIDIPDIEGVILNKATKSEPLYLQMCGRGSRLSPGKKLFYILDLGSNVYAHGDWNFDRDWHDAFHNPAKPKGDGVAPVKECVGCGVMIHASTKYCPHCNALNIKPATYDEVPVALELLNSKAPFTIDLPALIAEYTGKLKADGQPYKEMAALHEIKRQLIFHVQKIWRVKKLDEKTANRLTSLYQSKLQEWCRLKGKGYSSWLHDTSREWIQQEYLRVWNYGEQKKVA